jgi:hypothetical protein
MKKLQRVNYREDMKNCAGIKRNTCETRIKKYM